MVLSLIFMGFWWGECVEHDRKLQIDFWTSFWRRAFWSETLIADLGRLVRFLTKWRVDLGSLGRLESIGMFEIFEHWAEWIFGSFVNKKLVFKSFCNFCNLRSLILKFLGAGCIFEIWKMENYNCNFWKLGNSICNFYNLVIKCNFWVFGAEFGDSDLWRPS